MPGEDRTGPDGAGPLTGRGLGLCRGFGVAGFTERDQMSRSGWGAWPWSGGGRGWRHGSRAWSPAWDRSVDSLPSPDKEKETLQGEAHWLEQRLQAIRQRIDARQRS